MRRLAPLAFVAILLAPALGAGHQFAEQRRLVLSVQPEQLVLLVAYELRPGALADGLRARYDAGDDGQIRTAFERLARARVMAPRLRADLSVSVDGAPVQLRLADLAFPDAPLEGGRRGVAAVALYRADLPSIDRARELEVRVDRGQATLEAQATAPLHLRSSALRRRSGDPVLGPATMRRGRAVRLTVSSSDSRPL